MELTERFFQALDYASRLHATQKRKSAGDIPMVSHLLAVTSLVMEGGGTEDEAIAALLHDAVEDQGGRTVYEEIKEKFGSAVADIVLGCSDAESYPGGTKPPWQERKEHHIASLQSAGPSILLVIAADKLHNLRDLLEHYRIEGDAVWEHFKGGKDGTLWYFGEMLQVLQSKKAAPLLVSQLERVYKELIHLVSQT